MITLLFRSIYVFVLNLRIFICIIGNAMSFEPYVVALKPAVQYYEWGRRGATSIVGELLQGSRYGFIGATGKPKEWDIDPQRPYAELWLGDHANGPCEVVTDDGTVTINEFLLRGGQNVAVPFLFKLLAIQRPLSIQIHPDRITAQRLHAEDPKTYRDSNHKPEMAIAISEFELMVGLRPSTEVAEILNIPGIEQLMGNVDPSCDELSLNIVKRVLDASPSAVDAFLPKLMEYCRSNSAHEASLAMRLNEAHPNDIGCLAPYFMRYRKLLPGDALFIPANVPHFYISGDVIEVMAPSDNIVRGGLTPKHVDSKLFVELLRIQSAEATDVSPQEVSAGHTVYSSNADEFAVHIVTGDGANPRAATFPNGPRLGIVLGGEVQVLGKGNRGAFESVFLRGESFLITPEMGVVEFRSISSQHGFHVALASPGI